MFDLLLTGKIENLPRLVFIHSIFFILFMFSLISFSVPMASEVRPFFLLMVIFYWAIFRPTLIHPFLLFLYGLVFDLILGFPIGLHSILFLLMQWVIKNQRSFFMGQPYLVVWIGFACTCFSFFIIEWLFFSVLSQSFLNAEPIFFSFLLTVIMFPLITILFIFMHRMLPVVSKSLP